jgi:hypothetical protein
MLQKKGARVKITGNKQLQTRTLAISFACIVWCAFTAGAAQEPYDLDLKELRRSPVRRENVRRPPHKPKLPTPVSPAAGRENSSYTVRQGDHLFLILMKHYGLSSKAAEELIPEIVRLNGIRRPENLSVGQRLIIPIPPVTEAAAKTTLQSDQNPLPSPPPESAAVPPPPMDTHLERKITVNPSRPCLLAREVAEQLEARISELPPFIEAEGVTMSHDVRKIAVVCGLEAAEAYTFKRLLAGQGIKLLLFKDDEAPRAVIEGVAGGLGIPFSVTTADTAAELPLIYLFPAGIAGKDLRLTLHPDLPVLR